MSSTIDIETAPITEEQAKARGFTAPPRSYRKRELGESEDDYYTAWHDDTAQLDPGRSWICALGILYPAGPEKLILSASTEEDEEKVLVYFHQFLLGKRPGASETGEWEADAAYENVLPIVGHNIKKFDWPYLLAKALIRGMEGLHVNLLAARDHLIDTKVRWEEYYRAGGSSSSLDSICATLGWETKPGSGKDFWTYDHEKQVEYLSHDLYATQSLAEKTGCDVTKMATSIVTTTCAPTSSVDCDAETDVVETPVYLANLRDDIRSRFLAWLRLEWPNDKERPIAQYFREWKELQRRVYLDELEFNHILQTNGVDPV